MDGKDRTIVIRALRDFLDDREGIGAIEFLIKKRPTNDDLAEQEWTKKQVAHLVRITDDLVAAVRDTLGITAGEIG